MTQTTNTLDELTAETERLGLYEEPQATITRSQMRIWLRNEKKQAWNDDDDGIPMIDAILEELKKLDRLEAHHEEN